MTGGEPTRGASRADSAESGTGRLGTGLLLLTSAALGGIAVAVWNRRALVQLRNGLDPDFPAEAAEPRGPDTGSQPDEPFPWLSDTSLEDTQEIS